MKVIKLFFTIAALGALVVVKASSFDKEFKLWKKSPAKSVEFDKEVKVSGSGSIKLTNKSTAIRTFDLKPGTAYELTFYVRGQDVEGSKGNGGRIMLFDGRKKWGRITTRINNVVEHGTFDWRQGKAVIKSSDWGDKIRVSLAMRGRGTLWFDEVEFKEVGKEEKISSFRKIYNSDYQSLALVPQGTLGFFEPGEKVEFKIFYESKAKNLEYACSVKDESGKKIADIARRPLEKSFTLPGQSCGYYVIDADFFANGKKSRSLQSAFVVNRKFEKRDPFFQMGYGVHPVFYEAFKRVGAGSIAMKFSYFPADLSAEKLWAIAYQTYKPYLDSNDFELSAVMPMAMRRNRIHRSEAELKEGWPYISDKLLQRRKEYIDLILKNTQGRIKYVDFQEEISSSATIKNKYVGNWPEAMANYLILARMGARQVRRFDPSIKIRIGGNNVQACLQSSEPMVMGALINEFDYYIIDGYTGNWDLCKGKPTIPEGSLMSFYQGASNLARALGKSPIIGNSESGLSIHYGSRFDKGLAIMQAELTARQLLISKAAPVSHYEIHKPGMIPHPSSRELRDFNGAMFTIWKPVWYGEQTFHVPLPGGAAYATAAAQLKFVKKVDYFSVGQKYCAVYTKPDGSALAVLWSLKDGQKFTFKFPCDGQIVNMFGRESKLPAGKNNFILGSSPVYLTVKMPAKKLADELKKALQAQSPQFTFAAFYTAPGKAKVFIRNQTAEMKRGVLQGNTVSILPGKIAVIELDEPAAEVVFTDSKNVKYNIKIAPGNYQKAIKLAAKPLLDGSGNWLKNLPKGTLCYPDNIAPAEALQKELGYFKTSFSPNAHSVSADYWVAYDNENFYLAVKVDDPVHQQRSLLDVWKDDSVQLVFAFGDAAPSALYYPDPAPRTTFNYGAGLTGKGAVLVKYRGKNQGKKDFPLNITRKDGITFYEICIPFKELGGKPTRFGFVVFDNNYPTKRFAPYWLEHSGGIAGGEDESQLKHLLYQ